MRANNWWQNFHLLMKYPFNQHSSENECVLCMSAVFHSVQKADHPLHQLRPKKESQCGLPHRCLCCESSSVTLEDDHFVDFNHHILGFERPQTIRTNWLWTVKSNSYVDPADLVLEPLREISSHDVSPLYAGNLLKKNSRGGVPGPDLWNQCVIPALQVRSCSHDLTQASQSDLNTCHHATHTSLL